MKNNQNEYEVSVSLSFRETVKANSAGEAILKMESKYIHGKGRLPREWIEVDIDNNWFCQVED